MFYDTIDNDDYSKYILYSLNNYNYLGISPCLPDPCLNGGECRETVDMTDFVCSCPYGRFTGRLCEISE